MRQTAIVYGDSKMIEYIYIYSTIGENRQISYNDGEIRECFGRSRGQGQFLCFEHGKIRLHMGFLVETTLVIQMEDGLA